MIGIAGAAILYDTQKIYQSFPPGREVVAAMQLFSSLALLFWYVLQLVMRPQRCAASDAPHALLPSGHARPRRSSAKPVPADHRTSTPRHKSSSIVALTTAMTVAVATTASVAEAADGSHTAANPPATGTTSSATHSTVGDGRRGQASRNTSMTPRAEVASVTAAIAATPP
jgi:hypothetical protein